MSINFQKMQDLQFFYRNVPYYVNKGGQDGMAELAQQYEALVKVYQINVPQIKKLLKAHASLTLTNYTVTRLIARLEKAVMRFAQKQHVILTTQLAEKATRLPSPPLK